MQERRNSMRFATVSTLPLLLAAACLTPAAAQTADEQQTLTLHNSLRAVHAADPLAWDQGLAQQCAAFAARCQFRMPTGLTVGQNMGVTSSLDADGQTALMTQMWYESKKYYNFASPGFSANAGQFTQLVWKATKKIGCAAHVCGNIEGFGQAGTLVVCRYSPAGNVAGGFPQNVAPAHAQGRN